MVVSGCTESTRKDFDFQTPGVCHHKRFLAGFPLCLCARTTSELLENYRPICWCQANDEPSRRAAQFLLHPSTHRCLGLGEFTLFRFCQGSVFGIRPDQHGTTLSIVHGGSNRATIGLFSVGFGVVAKDAPSIRNSDGQLCEREQSGAQGLRSCGASSSLSPSAL
jgi:hypothetical protein